MSLWVRLEVLLTTNPECLIVLHTATIHQYHTIHIDKITFPFVVCPELEVERPPFMVSDGNEDFSSSIAYQTWYGVI
jgi:hypothetical protein